MPSNLSSLKYFIYKCPSHHIYTSTHLHLTSLHLHLTTSHHIYTSTHLHLTTSTPHHIYTSTHLHIHTSTPPPQHSKINQNRYLPQPALNGISTYFSFCVAALRTCRAMSILRSECCRMSSNTASHDHTIATGTTTKNTHNT